MSVKNFSSKIPNTEKLFNYLQKEQWQNVSANFTGFVKKEFEATLRDLEEDEENYKSLRMMIDFAEVGRYNDAKHLIDSAKKEFQELETAIQEREIFKHKLHQRPGDTHRSSYEDRKQHTYTPNKSNPGTPKRPDSEEFGGRRDTFSPAKREPGTPQRRDGYTPNISARQQGYSPNQYHEMTERGPRTPQKDTHRTNFSSDAHRANYESLRLHSPDKSKPNTPGGIPHTPNGRISEGSETRKHNVAAFEQFLTTKEAAMGRTEGDNQQKVGFSTYRQEYPEHALDKYERQDKNRYRDNFGSATQRDFMHYQDSPSDFKEEFRKLHRLQDTPDDDRRPSELARRFKDIYMNEWTEAHDEIVKHFGPEKSVRHLLWIVTEAHMLACDIAEDQLLSLEQRSYSVMTGHPKEAWLIALELGDKQLRDLEKSTFSIMSQPGSEHQHGSGQTRDLGESLPTSRNLLLKYRKQTASLSIPYVKEVCRDKICRTLLEKSGFPKVYLTDASKVVAYILKCAEIVWLMSVQDPPIVLEYITRETEGARFNMEHYHSYSGPGSIYKFGVWPLLRLDKRGPLLSKGVAQGVQ